MYLKLLDEFVYLKTAGWVCVSKSFWMRLMYLKLLDEVGVSKNCWMSLCI